MKKQWTNASVSELSINETQGMTPWHGNEHDFNGDGVINSDDEKAWKKAGRPLNTIPGYSASVSSGDYAL